MEDIDTGENSHNSILDEDDMIMREVIQEEPDLFFLHHYLTEVYRKR